MDEEDPIIIFALLLCLVVAIVGLYLGSGTVFDHDAGPDGPRLSSQPGQIMRLD